MCLAPRGEYTFYSFGLLTVDVKVLHSVVHLVMIVVLCAHAFIMILCFPTDESWPPPLVLTGNKTSMFFLLLPPPIVCLSVHKITRSFTNGF